MPRPVKGPRLYLRQGRIDSRTGKPIPDVWVIRDRGSAEIGTGFGPGRFDEAERALGEYIAAKWTPGAGSAADQANSRRPRDPDAVLIADVLAFYAPVAGANVKGFLINVLAWWGDMTCAEIRRSNCQAYVAHRCAQPNRNYLDAASAPRVSDQTARRELEALGEAVGYWHGEYPFTSRPAVSLPDKPESPRDALTRAQAAALLLAAMGWARDSADGPWRRLRGAQRTNRRHMRRFILLGLYTGTRHTVMRELLWEESATRPWVDLADGVIYRRGREVRELRTKRRPVVKIPARLLAHMRRWRAADARLEARLQVEDPEARIISVLHYGGHPLAGKIRTGFEGCVHHAGLDAEITPHWLRHTAATWLMQSGLDSWKAAGFLGMTVATLERHYAHHHPDYQREAASAAGRRA